MDPDRVIVRNVRGRYPRREARLESDNIEAQIVEETRLIRIRLDDSAHPDFWLEVTLEVTS